MFIIFIMSEFKRFQVDQIIGGPSLQEVQVGKYQRRYREVTGLFDDSRREVDELTKRINVERSLTEPSTSQVRELYYRRFDAKETREDTARIREEILKEAKKAGEPIKPERDDKLGQPKGGVIVEFPLPKHISLN